MQYTNNVIKQGVHLKGGITTMEEEKFNQIKYQNEFIKQKYDRVNLTVPKGKKEKIKAAAKAAGQSVNEYINSAIDSYMNL